jgi:predicted HicB family RNase H-like nuclease
MNISKTNHPAPNKSSKATAHVKGSEGESIRMNVNIPKAFHKQIKHRALDEDTTVTEIVIKALKEYLNK